MISRFARSLVRGPDDILHGRGPTRLHQLKVLVAAPPPKPKANPAATPVPGEKPKQ